MPRLPADASMEVRLLAAEARAARAGAAGRPREVRRAAATGLDTLAQWQESFGSLDLQSAVAMHGSGLVFAGLRAAVESGRVGLVFDWSERARDLHQRVVPLRPPPDPQFASDLAALRVVRTGESGWSSDPRAARLRERVRDRQWSATRGSRVSARAGLDELRVRLGRDTAHLAYVWDDAVLSALVVTQDETALVRVSDGAGIETDLAGLRADLHMAAAHRAGPIAAAVSASLARRLEQLSRVLVDPIIRHLGARRVVLAAPGLLAGLPWAMLPHLRGRPLTVVTSASSWVHADAARSIDRVGFAAGPRVARAGEEIRAAAAAWTRAEVSEGEAATVDAVTELAGRVDVLHLAAHGRHSAEHPLLSGIDLADGALFGYDIDRVRRVPQTVVLSSCEVGRSSVRGGEEAIGMTRMWLHAGASSVIAAPVVVADDDACELLSVTHRHLSRGASPAEALAAAAEDTDVHAPFQVHGNGF